jgi:hypothetical protein
MSKKPTKTHTRPTASEYTVEQGNTTLVTPGTRAHQDLIQDIEAGDFIKALLGPHERMWVQVEFVNGDEQEGYVYHGTVANEPVHPETTVEHGQPVTVLQEDILDVHPLLPVLH